MTSVVGFDIGNDNCVIAAARNCTTDVLLNDECKRETPAVVSFAKKQRLFGSLASPLTHTTISQVKRLIGVHYNSPRVQDDLKLLPFKTSQGSDGGVLISVPFLNEEYTFTPVQILAMLFAHLKSIAESDLNGVGVVTECVIGIPSYFTDLQRRAYLDAALIAGLTPLSLIHDGTAIALGYGLYMKDSAASGPTNVVFVDIGHSHTQVTVAAFEPGRMKILSHAFDDSLGGRDFDEILFMHFVCEFREQYDIDVCTDPRACIKLRASCEKLKKVLSASTEAPLDIPCLMGDKDVKGFITQHDFEKLCSHLLKRFSDPCVKAVNEAGIRFDHIHSIELAGSGSRIPAIIRKLASIFGRKPSRTLNATECVARGCALHCAMLSPTRRVREYEIQESYPFAIGLKTEEGNTISLPTFALYQKGDPFPSSKMLTFHRSNTFHLDVIYANENELPAGVSDYVSRFYIGPLASSHNVKVTIRFHLNLHGIVTIEAAWADETREGKAQRQNVTVYVDVYGGTTRDALHQAQELERKLADQDIKVKQTKDKRNALESFIYGTREKLLSRNWSCSTDEEREGILQKLQEIEDWLYTDGDDESEQVYTGRLEYLIKASRKIRKTAKAPVEQSEDEKEKAEIRKRLHLLREDMKDRPKAVKKGYDWWMTHEDCAMPQFVTFKEEIFRDANEFTLPINPIDIIELLTGKKLGTNILTIFLRSLYLYMETSLNNNKTGFLNPEVITADTHMKTDIYVETYLTKALKGYDFFVAPYLHHGHHVLLIICPNHRRGIILDSSKWERKRTKEDYHLVKQVERVVGRLIWELPVANLQKQDWECGFYVMKWVLDFVLNYQHNDNFPNILPWDDDRSLESSEMDIAVSAWFSLWSDRE